MQTLAIFCITSALCVDESKKEVDLAEVEGHLLF